MITVLDFARNEPCPCGSGRKYKKCCQPAVEALARRVAGPGRPWVGPQTALALGLLAALRPAEEEQLVDVQDLLAALARLEEELISTELDDEAWAETAARVTSTFSRLLEEDAWLADLRFTEEEVNGFLAWAEDQPALAETDPEDENSMEIFLEHVEEYLSGVLDASRCEKLAWEIIRAMRGVRRNVDDNASLLFALWLCLDDPTPNPVWVEIFLASLREFEPDEDEDDDEDEPEEGQERFADPAWPIVRTFIPQQDAWQAAGCGSAWVIQQQPDGLLALTVFNIQLIFGGLTGVFRRLDWTARELEKFLADCTKEGLLAPWQEGPLNLVSSFAWGSYAQSLREEMQWPPDVERSLEVVPKPPGNPSDWEAALVGPHGLTSPELCRVAQRNKATRDLPPGKEPVVLTTVTFSLADPAEGIRILKRMEPEFSCQGKNKVGGTNFTWTSNYPQGHESPLARTGERQVLAEIHFGQDTLTATTATLSSAARLMWKLHYLLGDSLHYQYAHWLSPEELRPSSQPRTPIFQFKVTLKGSKPPIWRRFQVESGITLHKLHQILQAVMGWQNCHLYAFTIQGTEYGEPDPDFDREVKNAKRYKLNQVIPGEKIRIRYEYDFGDGWEHEMVVEKILAREDRVSYPVCLAGRGACPPEDCGGIWGYYHLLEVMADPGHEEYEETLQWLDGRFDPTAFDQDSVNKQLATLRSKPRRSKQPRN